jgi:hypothetical protein
VEPDSDDKPFQEVLAGGVANPGVVVRVGDTVRRPTKRQTASVHRYLDHLIAQGLEEVVPKPLGFDEQGREILSFLDGEIALPPNTAWTAGDELLVSVADLQRRLQAASRSYVPPDDAVWDDEVGHGYFPTGIDGPVTCHNDLCVENVVIRDGLASAVIDFDYARPVDPIFDIAVAVRHWAPLRSPSDLDALEVDVDVTSRFQLCLDVFELRSDERVRTVELVDTFLERAYRNVHRLASEGHQGFATMIADGYLEQNRDSLEWLRANATELARTS